MISFDTYCRMVKCLSLVMSIIMPAMLVLLAVGYGMAVHLLLIEPDRISFGSVAGSVGFFVMLCLIEAVGWRSLRDPPHEIPD